MAVETSAGLGLRFLALVPLRKLAEEHIGDREAEHGITEKLQRLVVGHAAADVLVGARRVRHRVLEQAEVPEAVAGRALQRVELVPQAHDLPGRQLRPMAVDDAARLLDVFLVHGQADVAEAVNRQRKDVPHRAGRHDARHAVRLEQTAHDAGFDVGMRAKDDDEGGGGHGVSSPPRRNAFPPFLRGGESSVDSHRVHLQQDHRHVVVLRGAGGKRLHVAKDALAQLLGRQVGVLLEQPGETRFAETVVVGVHRFADAVGEQDVEISSMQWNRLLDEQSIEHLAVVELQAEHEAIRREHLRLVAVSVQPVPHATRISGVWPARAYVIVRAERSRTA